MYCSKRILAALLSTSLIGGVVEAQVDPRRPWAVGLAAQVDERSNSSTLLSFNWGVATDTWLSFAAEDSRSPAEWADVSARGLSARVDHRFGLVGATFEIEQWGDSAALESDDLTGALYFIGDRFRVGLELEQRDIEIHLLPLLDRPIRRTVAMTSDGRGLSWRVEPAPRWQLYGRFMQYDYSRNLSLLPRIDALNLLSTSALTLANSFVDEEAGFGVERELGAAVLNFAYNRDRSAVDGSRLQSFSVAGLFPVSRRIDIELNIGSSRSDFFGNDFYGGLLVLIYGG